ncbi:hypothetical protein [Vibrio cholerae]|uniref:hypothetical protein n=1 Tax=Vibrio cholerae TaxID=666 RepID=UPI0010FEEEB7|nr:hypothetical protein [Vibrio cholerae]TLE17679.1 hypothetical protein D2924_17770 [Vibrio cholerae]TLE36883.1 hypothetical protein D2925_03185 [Vibrio cholerae]
MKPHLQAYEEYKQELISKLKIALNELDKVEPKLLSFAKRSEERGLIFQDSVTGEWKLVKDNLH